MARARNIKPGLYKNEDLAECSIWARFIFPGLWMLADRDGRMEDRPKRIKGELLPYDSVEVDPLLEELARFGFILRYEVDGQRYIQICKFSEHQTPHVREQASTIPASPSSEQSTTKVVPEHCLGSAESSPRSPDSLIPSSLNPDSPIGAEAPAKQPPAANGSRLPADWKPSDEEVAFCATERPDLTASEVACRFRDYWIAQPGIKGRKSDWPATWRNWVRNEKAQPRASPPGRAEKFDPVAHVNRNRTRNQRDERTIDIDEFGEPIQQVV